MDVGSFQEFVMGQDMTEGPPSGLILRHSTFLRIFLYGSFRCRYPIAGRQACGRPAIAKCFFPIMEEDTRSYNMITENDKRVLKYIDENNLGYVLESISEVAEFYGKSFKTIEYWIKRGLPREKVGTKHYVYSLRNINDWLLEKNALNLSEKDVLFLRCHIIELETVLLRGFLYVDLPAAIKKFDVNQKVGVTELVRFIREWSLSYEYESIGYLKKTLEALEEQIDLPERE